MNLKSGLSFKQKLSLSTAGSLLRDSRRAWRACEEQGKNVETGQKRVSPGNTPGLHSKYQSGGEFLKDQNLYMGRTGRIL